MRNSSPGPTRRSQLAGLPAEAEKIESALLKIRAVLILLRTLHGQKRQRALALVQELRARRVSAAPRTLYHWRHSYLIYGLDGLVRRRRSDFGRPRSPVQGILVRISDAAVRIEKVGDIARKYPPFRDVMSYETFRFWVRWIQSRVVEFPRGKEA